MRTWLLLDCNYLCHRLFHAIPGLSHQGDMTGVVFGFLRDIISLQDAHGTNRIAFCFDYGRSLRALSHTFYKAKRHDNLTEEEQASRDELMKQINRLRKRYLPELGFRNVFYQKGYEADDVIASVCLGLKENDRAVIISNDQDLYQLLSPRVSIWNVNKKKMMTEKTFSETYGITPTQWIDVKSIAGCSSDNIEGVRGIGEKTAIKFLQGKLKTNCKAFEKIVKGNKTWRRNIGLVKLPYPGVNDFRLRRDKVNAGSWEELADRLGMKTLRTAWRKLHESERQSV